MSGSKAILSFFALLLFASSSAGQGTKVSERVEGAAGLIRAGKMAEAESQLEAVLKLSPEEPGALNLLGTIRAGQNRLDEAEQLFLRASRADARFAGPRMNLAYLYLLKGLPEKAASELKEVVRLDPENADAAHKLARLLLTGGRLVECVDFVEGVKERKWVTPTLFGILGDCHLGRGDAARAEESYQRALRADERDVAALVGMARAAHARSDVRAASLYLSRARAASSESAEFLYGYGLVALKLGLAEESVSALTRAAELKPDDAAVLFALGSAWLKKPDLFEAETRFRRFLTLRPGDARGQLFLGYALLKQKRYDEARALLETSVKANDAAPEGGYYLGLVAQEQKEDARAVEILERVVTCFPAYPHARVALGVSYLRLKNYERARAELERAVELNPEDQKAHYNLALLYARLKDPQRAQEEMRIVERLKDKNGAQAEDEISSPQSPGPR